MKLLTVSSLILAAASISTEMESRSTMNSMAKSRYDGGADDGMGRSIDDAVADAEAAAAPALDKPSVKPTDDGEEIVENDSTSTETADSTDSTGDSSSNTNSSSGSIGPIIVSDTTGATAASPSGTATELSSAARTVAPKFKGYPPKFWETVFAETGDSIGVPSYRKVIAKASTGSVEDGAAITAGDLAFFTYQISAEEEIKHLCLVEKVYEDKRADGLCFDHRHGAHEVLGAQVIEALNMEPILKGQLGGYEGALTVGGERPKPKPASSGTSSGSTSAGKPAAGSKYTPDNSKLTKSNDSPKQTKGGVNGAPHPPRVPSKATDWKDYLIRHNKYRCMHDAPMMTWSNCLAESAQAWVNRGVYEHATPFDLKGCEGPAGENLALGHTDAMWAIDHWYSEVDMYETPQFKNKFSKECGHFTVMVWTSVKELGCGVGKNTEGRPYYVCRYKHGDVIDMATPNMQGQYEKYVLPRNNKSAEACEKEAQEHFAANHRA